MPKCHRGRLGMDVNFDVESTLTRLDVLSSSVTNAKKDLLSEMKIGRSHSCVPYWRNEHCSCGGGGGSGNSIKTKENMDKPMTLFCSGSGSSQGKTFSRRCNVRCPRWSPYDLFKTRKPLATMMSVRGSPGGSPCLSHHSMFQQHELSLSDALTKRKTEQFPVPLLSRSKSLEDLRESPKVKAGHGRRHYGTSYEVSISSVTRRDVASQIKPDIKNEIDSMSMQIQKLDVA